jgi:tripartite-type tricarboxylate transporter receptor subunit TctC
VSQIQGGRVKAIAVLSPERLAALPNVPTTKESGYENFEMSVWYGILAPSGTPREIITRLNGEFTRATASADLKERFAAAGVDPLSSTPEQFGAFIRAEAARFAKVVKDAGIKAE